MANVVWMWLEWETRTNLHTIKNSNQHFSDIQLLICSHDCGHESPIYVGNRGNLQKLSCTHLCDFDLCEQSITGRGQQDQPSFCMIESFLLSLWFSLIYVFRCKFNYVKILHYCKWVEVPGGDVFMNWSLSIDVDCAFRCYEVSWS